MFDPRILSYAIEAGSTAAAAAALWISYSAYKKLTRESRAAKLLAANGIELPSLTNPLLPIELPELTTLDMVARAALNLKFAYSGLVELDFKEARYFGPGSVEWKQYAVTGTCAHSMDLPDGEFLDFSEQSYSEGIARSAVASVVENERSPVTWKADHAYIVGRDLTNFPSNVKTRFQAVELDVSYEQAHEAFAHRHVFRDISIRVYREFSGYESAGRLERRRDAISFSLFGRNAKVVRSIFEDTDDEATIVAYEGSSLNIEEQKSLWIVLSLIGGNRARKVCSEHFTADIRKQSGEYFTASGARREPKAIISSSLSSRNAAGIGDGLSSMVIRILELERAGVPISVAVDYLFESQTEYLDISYEHTITALDLMISSYSARNGAQYAMLPEEYDRLISPVISSIRYMVTPASEGLARDLEDALRRGNVIPRTDLDQIFAKGLEGALSADEIRILDERGNGSRAAFLTLGASVQERYVRVKELQRVAFKALFAMLAYNPELQ